MDAPLAGGGSSGPARSQLAASSAAPAHCAAPDRPHRGPAAATLDRQGDRRRDRRLTGHGQPCVWRLGLNRLAALEPAAPLRRYERDQPGELIHLDIKKLGRIGSVGHRITGRYRGAVNRHRGIGWEFVHVCIDDASRLAFTQIKPDQRKQSAVTFLRAAVAYYKRLGITVERVMTDNGSCYRSNAFRKACRRLGLRHIFTRPYTPRTNGKAERFIQTSLREWAYARAYDSSRQRAKELPVFIHRYNWHRPHAGIGGHPPISKLGLTGNNLLRLHS
jgi:transposase InsO family protein